MEAEQNTRLRDTVEGIASNALVVQPNRASDGRPVRTFSEAVIKKTASSVHRATTTDA